jgi:hypothetical protein
MMLPEERELLARDKLPEAKALARKNAIRGSLVARILSGEFGRDGPAWLYRKEAMEIVLRWEVG